MNNNITNLIIALVCSVAIIFGWQFFYEKPKLDKLAEANNIYNQKMNELKKVEDVTKYSEISRDEAICSSDARRVKIKSGMLSGSILLKGLRFDDLTLLDYHENIAKNSSPVELFSPTSAKNAYFAEIGWIGVNAGTTLPHSDTVWNTESDVLTPEAPVSFVWVNPEGVKFQIVVTLDENYLFTIKQSTTNNGQKPISVQYYGLINRNYNAKEKLVNILHQGPIGVINGKLEEQTYDDVRDKKVFKFSQSVVDWVGITDKYWLAAFVPDKTNSYSSNFNYAIKDGFDKFQIDFVSSSQVIGPNDTAMVTHRLFAGAKKVDLLDNYEKVYNIKLFDRAIDFGWFYYLTKPVFIVLSFFYKYVGNLGISILIVTVMIKLAMFTLANKSYRSMKKMKALQPEVERVKALYGEDKTRLNQEIMTLYKKEKVNPVSGCLPLFVQIPVFFSIYKVLYVTIEMRHAPFFGWIKDLSAPDPTTIFNLFGLLPYSPPSFLMIGAWPIFMAVTMFLQQRMSPEPADPVQAQVMRFMPLIFLVMFSSFPAGLLIYWSWNNILSIIQQYYINKLDHNVR